MYTLFSPLAYFGPISAGLLGTGRSAPLSWLNHLTYNLDVWCVGWPWLHWDCRSHAKNPVLTSLLPFFKVRVQVTGEGHFSGAQQSILGLGFAVWTSHCEGVCLRVYHQWACANNWVDAVDWLLIFPSFLIIVQSKVTRLITNPPPPAPLVFVHIFYTNNVRHNFILYHLISFNIIAYHPIGYQ